MTKMMKKQGKREIIKKQKDGKGEEEGKARK